MRVDIGNALSSVAAPGISRAGLEALDRDVAAAHERIEAGRERDEFGYASLDLPGRTDVDAIRDAVEPFRDMHVLTVGIGGSALGAATLSAALGVEGHEVLDNVDPEHTRAVLDRLPLADTVVNVVSKSGTTTETLATFLVVREAMRDAGVDWTERTLITTGESGPLREMAERNGLPVLDVPEGVPGRFAVLSAVGLVPAAIRGRDVESVLDGAAAEADRLAGSVFDCPAYAYGAVAEALARRGVAVNAVMPYAESLEYFAEWFAQLWAESLGKDGLGQVPARALGATDQHSQLQRYRAGPRNVMVTFVRARDRPSLPIPDPPEALSPLEGEALGTILDTELRATEASLAAAGRPNVRVEIERVDAAGIGELLYGMEAACVMAGELAGVETFEQPAVEWAKEATRDLLRGEDSDVARAVEDKETLWVE